MKDFDVRFQTVFPFVLKRVESLKAAALLDFGCGPGDFLELVRPHAGKIYGYDLAPQAREAARKNAPHAVIADDMKEIPRGGIDIVTMNAVWMQFPDEKTCLGVLKDIHAVLKPGGTFIASVTHPCFRDHSFVTHETDFNNANYLKSGTPFTVFVGGKAMPRATWDDFHWTLADHINQLTASGFRIARATEMPDDKGLSQWLVFEAVKP